MKITWLGHSAFKIEGGGVTIVHDPYKNMLRYHMPKSLKVDIVLSSHDHYDHNNIAAVEGEYKYINSMGVHNYMNISIEGVPSYHDDTNGYGCS